MMPGPLLSDHILSQQPTVGGGFTFIDTTALDAHGLGVDTRTGFMPPDPPISRLPVEWEPWEAILDQSLSIKLQVAVKPDLTEDDMARSASWRSSLRNNLPMLSTRGLTTSEVLLRRAHHVLTFVMHMYIHTLPLHSEIRIPPNISIPLLEVSASLQLPPVASYSDTVLYNWCLRSPLDGGQSPAPDNLRSQDLFTGANDEQEFYLTSARIEIRGAEALELMYATMAEMVLGDETALQRIAGYLYKLAYVVDDLTRILLSVRQGCDPEFFYHRIRPWFRGQDSDPMSRKWIFEGLEEYPGIQPPTDLSGSSAGQSALIHALDIFLGLDSYSVGEDVLQGDRRRLLRRMQTYMPRHHRNVLRHLAANPRPVRNLVITGDPKLIDAYNNAVHAVKGFRDAHLRIVALYIIQPAARERSAAKEAEGELAGKKPLLRGTGGTHLMQFLKGVRDHTAEAVVGVESVPVLCSGCPCA